ncbi:MAG: diguanylate cyclase [Acidobacteria bacterium]|nr:diguanylate cyclase [Acidobacteriota bacterium]
MNHLEDAIAKLRHDSSKKFAVLFLDLDRFKIINDGLRAFDRRQTPDRHRRTDQIDAPSGDIVARLGGDEFTLLIHNVKDVSDATMVAERIQHQLANPFRSRQLRGLFVGEHRNHHLRRHAPQTGGFSARRRCGDVPRERSRQGAVRDLRRGNVRPQYELAAGRNRPAARA